MSKKIADIDQLEVYVTKDELGRASIVRHKDVLLRIYTHWIWGSDTRKAFNVTDNGRNSWLSDRTSLPELYEDIEPLSGIYGSLEDARLALRGLPGFSDASPLTT